MIDAMDSPNSPSNCCLWKRPFGHEWYTPVNREKTMTESKLGNIHLNRPCWKTGLALTSANQFSLTSGKQPKQVQLCFVISSQYWEFKRLKSWCHRFVVFMKELWRNVKTGSEKTQRNQVSKNLTVTLTFTVRSRCLLINVWLSFKNVTW